MGAESKRVISVLVRLKIGDFLINRTILKEDMEISEGICRAVSGQSLIEVINYVESDQELFLDEPINVVEFKSTQHFELNIKEEERNGNSSTPFDKIRTDHLNKEEVG